MVFIGLDAGSVSVKLVVLDEEGNRREGYYTRHKGHPLKVALELLEKVAGEDRRGEEEFSLSVTGSSGRFIAGALALGFTNELVAQTYATRRALPGDKDHHRTGR